jgi:hypothetical protein
VDCAMCEGKGKVMVPCTNLDCVNGFVVTVREIASSAGYVIPPNPIAVEELEPLEFQKGGLYDEQYQEIFGEKKEKEEEGEEYKEGSNQETNKGNNEVNKKKSRRRRKKKHW